MMTLEQLRASAPRTFDKTLIDLLVAIQDGHKPIATGADATYDDTALRQHASVMESRVAKLEMTLEQVIAGYRQLEADNRQLSEMLAHHTHETIRQVA